MDTTHGEHHKGKQIFRALLDQAMRRYRQFAFSGTRRGRRIFLETEAWIRSDHEAFPVPFTTVCAALGLEPVRVRRGLERWRSRSWHRSGRRSRKEAIDGPYSE